MGKSPYDEPTCAEQNCNKPTVFGSIWCREHRDAAYKADHPSPITPEAEAELQQILIRVFTFKKVSKDLEPNGAWLTKGPFVTQKQIDEAKQSLIQLLVRERVEGGQGYNRAFTGALGKPTYMNDKDGRQTVYKQEWVSAAVREANNGILAHLESLLQEDNPPIW